MKTYAGIGSRKTPQQIQDLMCAIATHLEQHNWTLRTGGAPGADQAFLRGTSRRTVYRPANLQRVQASVSQTAYQSVRDWHPATYKLSSIARQLLARNYLILFGDQETPQPVRFVLCWTPDSCLNQATRTPRSGGTGQTVCVAAAAQIPVFNLSIDAHRHWWQQQLQTATPITPALIAYTHDMVLSP